MKRIAIGILAAAIAAAAVPAAAQEKKPEPPKPGAEHKKMGYFVGRWTTEGESKPGPMGPGGKMSEKADCNWIAGGFFVSCTMSGSSAMGNFTALGVLGYDPAKKVYTWNGFNSMGLNEAATGNVEGKTWTYTNEMAMGGKNIKGRYTMVEQSADAYTIKFETSEDGKTWTTAMEGKTTKAAAK